MFCFGSSGAIFHTDLCEIYNKLSVIHQLLADLLKKETNIFVH